MNDPKDNAEPFLSRWSRKKQGATRGRTDDVVSESAGGEANGAAARGTEKEPELDLSKLPKAEDLTAESDITAFLDKRVPAMLRNAALGRMWTLDPTIRDFIEVAENQWNWNIPGGAPFYEPIETIVSGAEGVVEAGSTLVDALATHVSVVQRDEKSIVLDETVCIRPKDNPVEPEAGERFVAAHEDLRPAYSDRPVETSTEALVTMRNLHSIVDDAATQQNAVSNIPARRRHGGALPG